MKVIAFNGSPKAEGNTFAAMNIVSEELMAQGIEVEIANIGNKSIRGCLACGKCAENKNEKCVINDIVNEMLQKVKSADGVIIGSPVHFSDIGGTMKCFLDRFFYVSHVNGNFFRHKVGAAVVAVRRSGGSATFDSLNHYLQFAEMMIPTSNYWNIIHGTAPSEAHQDSEGVQIMKVLGRNMAYLMKCMNEAKGKIEAPAKEKKLYMNFIR